MTGVLHVPGGRDAWDRYLPSVPVCLSVCLSCQRLPGCVAAQESMRLEAESLAKASFGEMILHAIGRVYETQADIFLGNFFEGTVAAFRQKGRTIKSQFHAVNLAMKMLTTQQQLERLDR
jgi:X-domain of DnaJ-containing